MYHAITCGILTMNMARLRPNGSVIQEDITLPIGCQMNAILAVVRGGVGKNVFIQLLCSCHRRAWKQKLCNVKISIPSHDAWTGVSVRYSSWLNAFGNPVRAGITIDGNATDKPRSRSRKFFTVLAITWNDKIVQI